MHDDNDLLKAGLLDRDDPRDGCHEYVPPDDSNGDTAQQRVTLIDPSTVPLENMKWEWPGYFARDHLSQISARYETGKSTAATDLAARKIQGRPYPLGGGSFERGRVLWVHPDEPEKDPRRRFYLAGLSESEVHAGLRFLSNGPRLTLTLRELFWLEAALKQWPADLVILDTIGDLDNEGDLQKPGPGKARTAALARVAARSGACIIALAHTRKGKGHGRHDAIYGAGSVPGSFCSAYVVRQRAPDDPKADESAAPKDYGIFCVKSGQTATKPAPFGFSIVGLDLDGIEGGVVGEWRTSPGFAEEESLDFVRKSSPERMSGGEAVAWLLKRLQPGPAWVAETEEDALKVMSYKRFREARKVLATGKKKVSVPWAMYLPDDPAAKWGEDKWQTWAKDHPPREP